MSFTPLTEQQNRWLNQLALTWVEAINESVPVFAVDEWIHARQKLGILYRFTQSQNMPIYKPTPTTFGGVEAVDAVEDQMTEVFRTMNAAGVPKGHPIFAVFEPASDSVMTIAPAFHRRQVHAVQHGLHTPLFVPVGLIPEMNHFTRWADGDGTVDLQSWLVAPPRPIFPPFK